jgi:hypothetical protein
METTAGSRRDRRTGGTGVEEVVRDPAGVAAGVLGRVMNGAGVPGRTLALVRARVAQVRGLARAGATAGLAGERLRSLPRWRESRCYSEAERAALALAEYGGREAVPEQVWQEAARHYDERGLTALALMIGTAGLFDGGPATAS